MCYADRVYRLIVWYFRFFDRRLRRRFSLQRDDFESGEWNKIVGNTGEDLACCWLWAHGMKVLYRQYTAPGGGEVDIVARDGDVLVFCEVKTRSTGQFGNPADAVDTEKRKLITRGANSWIQELGFMPLRFRFDIIEVILQKNEIPQLNHITNAFQSAPRLLA